MSGFTPGPWYKTPPIPRVATTHSRIICECQDLSAQWTQEDHANATLIAAAPDLFAACEAAFSHLENGTGEIDDVKAELRTALSKAKGEAL